MKRIVDLVGSARWIGPEGIEPCWVGKVLSCERICKAFIEFCKTTTLVFEDDPSVLEDVDTELNIKVNQKRWAKHDQNRPTL